MEDGEKSTVGTLEPFLGTNRSEMSTHVTPSLSGSLIRFQFVHPDSGPNRWRSRVQRMVTRDDGVKTLHCFYRRIDPN